MAIDLFGKRYGVQRDLMDILVCLVGKGKLQLIVNEENGGDVVASSLHCGKCGRFYPIVNTIPNLLFSDVYDVSSGM